MESSESAPKASLNVISIILQGWNAYVRNLVAFIVMHVIFYGPLGLFALLLFYGLPKSNGAAHDRLIPDATLFGWMAVVMAGSTLLPLLMMFLWAGLVKAYLKAARGNRVKVLDLFSGAEFFVSFFVGGLILGVVSWGLMSHRARVPLGLAAVFLLFMFSLTFFIVVDKKVGIFTAMARSWDTVKMNLLPTLAVFVLFVGVPLLLGLLDRIRFAAYAVMPVNYLVLTPVLSCAFATLYDRLPGPTILTRTKRRAPMLCPKCKTVNDENSWKCTNCGYELHPPADKSQPAAGDVTSRIIPYKNPNALMAYYCGVFSIIPFFGLFLGPAGFVLGILGLKYLKRHRDAHGAAHAWIGIIVGGLFGLANIVGIFWFYIYPMFVLSRAINEFH